MIKVDIGSMYIPNSIVEAVEKHKKMMLETHKNSDSYDFMLNADFGTWFSDYLYKFGGRLLDS